QDRFSLQECGDEQRNVARADAAGIQVRTTAVPAAAGDAVHKGLNVPAVDMAVEVHIARQRADAPDAGPETAGQCEGPAAHDRRRLGVAWPDRAGEREDAAGAGPTAAIDGIPGEVIGVGHEEASREQAGDRYDDACL